jgi:hypothetical protein
MVVDRKRKSQCIEREIYSVVIVMDKLIRPKCRYSMRKK